MNITLLALIRELNHSQRDLMQLLIDYEIYNWEESKVLLNKYQELINKLDTARG